MMMMYDDKKKRGYGGIVCMPKISNPDCQEDMHDDALSAALYALKAALSAEDMSVAKKAFKTAVSLCAHAELADDYNSVK